MFELPEAKRVRRKDLYDSPSDESESDGEERSSHDSQAESALRAKLNARLGGLLDISFAVEPAATKAPRQQTGGREDQSRTQAPAAADHEDEQQQAEEEVFAFRLFRDEALTHTVVLTQDDDPAALGEGGFVIPSRPRSYYIAAAPSEEKASEYRRAAVSAEHVLADARRRRWGLEKPWRVLHIECSRRAGSSTTLGADGGGVEGEKEKKQKKRTRPGKKHRILVRVREKAAREREAAAKKMALEKEEHIQEKKKRLNRERKLKRRQKEREKKAEAQGIKPEGGGDADDN